MKNTCEPYSIIIIYLLASCFICRVRKEKFTITEDGELWSCNTDWWICRELYIVYCIYTVYMIKHLVIRLTHARDGLILHGSLSADQIILLCLSARGSWRCEKRTTLDFPESAALFFLVVAKTRAQTRATLSRVEFNHNTPPAKGRDVFIC